MNDLQKEKPLYTLSVSEAEEYFKTWIKDVINSESKPEANTLPAYRTRGETAKLLHLSLPTLDAYIRAGLIESKRIGSRVLFEEESIKSALNKIPIRRR